MIWLMILSKSTSGKDACSGNGVREVTVVTSFVFVSSMHVLSKGGFSVLSKLPQLEVCPKTKLIASSNVLGW